MACWMIERKASFRMQKIMKHPILIGVITIPIAGSETETLRTNKEGNSLCMVRPDASFLLRRAALGQC